MHVSGCISINSLISIAGVASEMHGAGDEKILPHASLEGKRGES